MHIFPNEDKEIIEANMTAELMATIRIDSDKGRQKQFVSYLNTLTASDKSRSFLERVVEELSTDPHPDLIYGSAIAASTVINGNDDVFLPQETYSALSTLVHTPFNQNHDKEWVYGHIIGSRAVDADGVEIISAPGENDFFDIEAAFVLYPWVAPDLVDRILKESENGLLGVSVEARLSNFNYVLFDDESMTSATVVPRNKETSYLTKHLRIFGGSGYVEGKKIGRGVKEFRFRGLANTPDPANARSLYTNFLTKSTWVTENNCINTTEPDIYKENITMGDDAKTLEQLKQDNESLSKKLESLQAKLDETQTNELNEKVQVLETKLEASEQKIAELEGTNAENAKNLEASEKSVANLTAELEQIKIKELAASRVNELTAAGFEIKDQKAALEKYGKMDENAFSDVLAFIKAHPAVKPEATEESEKDLSASVVVDEEAGLEPSDEDDEKVTLYLVASEIAKAMNSKRENSKGSK